MKNPRNRSVSYRRKPASTPESTTEVGSGLGRGDSKKRRFTIEELVKGMTPVKEHPMEDDWPVGDELI